MRTIGPFVDGYSLFWAVEGRGRKSVTCDLRVARGPGPLPPPGGHRGRRVRELPARDHGGVGTRPRRARPPPGVRAHQRLRPGRPLSARPGLDRLGVAYGGLLHLTGEPDRPPVRPGVTVSDYLTGVFAAEAALAALYRRDAGRARADGSQGAVVDASLYGSVLRILEWTIPAYDRLGTVRSARGTGLSNSAPLDNYPTADGKYVCVVAGGDANFARLCRAMDRPDLLEDPRFATLADRAAQRRHHQRHRGAVDVEPDRGRGRAACVAHDVPVATAYTARDIALDPHFAARRDLVAVDDPVLGPLRQQAPYPAARGRAGARAGRSPRSRRSTTARCGATSSGCRRPSSTSLQAKGIV